MKKLVAADVCMVEGCSNPHFRRGYCRAHHHKWVRYGEALERPIPAPKLCAIEGCDKPSKCHDLCNMHYLRLWKFGDPFMVKPHGGGTRKGYKYTKPRRHVPHPTHGLTGTPTYRSWLSMKARCGRTGSKDYPQYGGRGITVCERWRTFENFLTDMGERPEGTTLDRRDNEGNYEPGNCRWATAKEQANNRRPRQEVSE